MLVYDRKNEMPTTSGQNGFFQKFRGLFLHEKVKNIVIGQCSNIEALLLRTERLQLRWYSHVTRLSDE